jgi:hypothetical protein
MLTQLLNWLPLAVVSTPTNNYTSMKHLRMESPTSDLQPTSEVSCITYREPPPLLSSATSSRSSPTSMDPSRDEFYRNQKATKSDNAPVPEYLWDRCVVRDDDPAHSIKLHALGVLRLFALRWWRRHLTRDFLSWCRATHGSHWTSFRAWRDREAGCECVTRAANSSWWEWKDGSRPFFWRWPTHYHAQIRDGLRLWCHHSLPKWRVLQ